MKKRLISKRTVVFCVLALLLCSAFGCASPQPSEPPKSAGVTYRQYLMGTEDHESGNVYSRWSIENTWEHQDASAPKEATVDFNGKRCTGQYDYTTVDIPATYPAHRYRGDGFSFAINAETGKLVWFEELGTTDAVCDPQTCRDIADAFARQYISIDEYTVTVTQKQSACKYEYCRQVNGIRTSDRMVVWVEGDGTVSAFRLYEPRAFDGVTAVFDEEKAFQVLKDEIEKAYKGDSGEIIIEVNDRELVKLHDGRTAMIYDVSVEHGIGSEGLEFGGICFRHKYLMVRE